MTEACLLSFASDPLRNDRSRISPIGALRDDWAMGGGEDGEFLHMSPGFSMSVTAAFRYFSGRHSIPRENANKRVWGLGSNHSFMVCGSQRTMSLLF